MNISLQTLERPELPSVDFALVSPFRQESMESAPFASISKHFHVEISQ